VKLIRGAKDVVSIILKLGKETINGVFENEVKPVVVSVTVIAA